MTDLFPNTKVLNRTGIDWTHIPEDIEHVSGSGAMSRGQINGIVSELKRLATEGFKGTVGVVSPFKIQANRIYDAVLQAFESNLPEKWNFHVDTANGFQGDERDIILLSLVGGKTMPRGAEWFLKNDTSPNLFNVAVSRAKIILHVFGDKEWARSCEIPHIVKLAQAYDRYVMKQDYVFRSDLIGPVWEPTFAEALRGAKIPFVQQYPVCGSRFYLDFAIINSSIKLDIEIDGEMFHRDSHGKRRIEDFQRDILLIAHGWKIKRFWVYELRENLDRCIQSVNEMLKNNA
jgi:very-short-patch-repair endonuclease